MATIEFQNVSKTYRSWLPLRAQSILGAAGPVRAIENVSLRIQAGGCWALLGPNRAGKTTLVKLLLSLSRPTAGQVIRLDRPAADRRTLARVGYVPDRPAFPGYLSAREVLRFYGACSGLPAKTINDRSGPLLAQFGLADAKRTPIHRYSKGMQQRLALAQAVLNDPAILVLDEPSEGLDLFGRRLLADLLRERRSRGQTSLLVSHSLSDVGVLCDHAAVLHGGRLAYAGPLNGLPGRSQNAAPESLEDSLEELYEAAPA